jgi:tRNA(Ile)-lysidine synthase
VRKHQLIRAGDRIGIAVSGGADSVALLRALVQLRDELGCILAVVHLHHGLRAADADADAAFVEQLAAEHSLEFHCKRRDVAALATKEKLSIEAAGRRARLEYFAELQAHGVIDKVATAHTANDQAETVLLKFLRGAGTRGIAGIYPQSVMPPAGILSTHLKLIRPLLDTTRAEVESFLRELNQPWREDATNQSPEFLRNRVRHELLPALARDFNPAIVELLGNTAEIAREEQEYWDAIVRKTLTAIRSGWGQFLFDLKPFCELPVALQRRIVIGLTHYPWDFDQIEKARKFIVAGNAGEREITRRTLVRVSRDPAGHPLFQIVPNPLYEDPARGTSFSVKLKIPGHVDLPLRNHRMLNARLFSPDDLQKLTAWGVPSGYALLDSSLCGCTLTIRNWQPGDRYQPVGRGEGKVKDFFKEFNIPAYARATWPLGELDGQIVWVDRLPVAARYVQRSDSAVVIFEMCDLFI